MTAWEIIGVVLMPVTYGFVGWLTNTTALYMTLYPLRFRGVRPFFGWQGLVPRRAAGLALTAVRMLQAHVLDLDGIFRRLKPHHLQRGMAPLVETSAQAALAQAVARAPEGTLSLDVAGGELAVAMTARATSALAETTEALQAGSRGSLNFKGLVLRSITGPNVEHLVEIFRRVGDREFAFIRKSGWLFGGLLGLGQAGVWLLFPQWWMLPLLGAVVGALTNWIALAMVFRPLHERRFLGMRWQGLFLKRQAEVADNYAEVFAERVLSPRNLLGEVLHRPLARRLVDGAHAEVRAALARAHPDQAALVDTYEATAAETRRSEVDETSAALADGSAAMERLMARRMDVRTMMSDRMRAMSPEDFEPILRTAFQDDEHILIVVGAILGALVGLAQGLFMLAST